MKKKTRMGLNFYYETISQVFNTGDVIRSFRYDVNCDVNRLRSCKVPVDSVLKGYGSLISLKLR